MAKPGEPQFDSGLPGKCFSPYLFRAGPRPWRRTDRCGCPCGGAVRARRLAQATLSTRPMGFMGPNARVRGPPAIRVMRTRFVSEAFHARFSAKGKTYRYRIWNATVLPPFESGRAWHVVNSLDFASMARAANEFCGEHDFASFSANRGTPETNTFRIIRAVRLRRAGPCISIEIEGDGFLYKMVRMMVGTLVRVGLNQSSPREIKARLRSPREAISRGRTAAPAGGLFLFRVRY